VSAVSSPRRACRFDPGPGRLASQDAADTTVDERSDDAATDERALTDRTPPTLPVPLLPLYTPAEAARLLAVPESWLRRRVTARLAPHTVLGKHLRFSHADLVAIATAAARPAVTALPARRLRRGRGPRTSGGW
jgi:hypothetical protein